jgi:hypothetical protein
MLQSIFAWFLWGTFMAFFVQIITILSALFLFYHNKFKIKLTRGNLIILITLFIVQIYMVRELKPASLSLAFLRFINIFCVLIINDKVKFEIFKFITNSISILLGISLMGWVLYLVGIPLPYVAIDSSYGPYLNYFFFIVYDESSYFSIIPRFSSIFLEPGYLGMITSLIIIAHQFRFNKISLKILFASTIFSFSLAAFLVLILSYIIYLSFSSNRFLLYLTLLIILLFSLYQISLEYNSGENAIYNYLFKRLEFSDGEISGYNRFSSDLEAYYYKFVRGDNLFFGIGEQEFRRINWDGGNAGYKVFIIQYGILGTILVLFLYLFILLKYFSKVGALLFLAYSLIFLQAAYPLIEFQLLLFVLALPSILIYNKQRVVLDDNLYN